MNRLLKVAVYIWIGFVFFWMVFVSILGGSGPARGLIAIILIGATMFTGITLAGYGAIWLVSKGLIVIDEGRKRELMEEIKNE